MRFIVLGAGMQGTAIAYDLARAEGATEVVVADRDEARVAAALARARGGAAKLSPLVLDIRDERALDAALRGAAGVVGAVSYDFNYDLARAAIRAGASFCDLGGNNDMVRRELTLDDDAKRAGVSIIPDCGLAPGLASMLVAEGMRRLGGAERIEIRVGGLPQNPLPPLDYQLTFAVRGLVNEYVEPSIVLRDGRAEIVPPMTEVETVVFPAPFGALEAFHTSGGSSTLPETYAAVVRDLNYKTIRYPGHCAKIKMMMDLGLLSGEPVRVRAHGAPAGDGGVSVAPRDLFEAVVPRHLPVEQPDVVLVRVALTRAGEREPALVFEMIDRMDAATGFTAMARTTGFPAAVAIYLAARGEVSARGSLPQERCLNPRRFLEEVRRRGLPIDEAAR